MDGVHYLEWQLTFDLFYYHLLCGNVLYLESNREGLLLCSIRNDRWPVLLRVCTNWYDMWPFTRIVLNADVLYLEFDNWLWKVCNIWNDKWF